MHDPGGFETIPELLSEPRFQTFLDAYSGRRDLAMRLYAWNVELTTSFWGPVSVLEVILRNSIHDALRRGRRDDWWNAPEVHLLERERRHLDQAHRALVHRGQTEPSAGQVVAATSLGLWVGLTDAGIPRHPRLSYETALWQPRLHRAFPHTSGVRRKELHRLLDDIRFFRNRMAHHEPIHRAPLHRIRDDIIRVAGFIDPEAALFIARCDRVEAVIERKREAIALGLGCI